MPKLKPNDLEVMNGLTRATISYGLEKKLMNKKNLSVFMRCTECTVRNKLSNPDTFTLKDLRAIIKSLKLTDSQVIELIGIECKEVAGHELR